MKKVQVRCWEITVPKCGDCAQTAVLVTYAEGDYGYELRSCLECGEIYAVDVAWESYLGPPLDEALRQLNCANCGCSLAESSSEYPSKFLCSNGVVSSVERPPEAPAFEASQIRELYGIYGEPFASAQSGEGVD